MKKLKKIVLALVTAMSLFGCKNQLENGKENFPNYNKERRKELAELAVIGNYSLSEDEVTSNLLSFLSGKEDLSRAAVTEQYSIKKIDSETISLANVQIAENRSASLEKYDDVDFYLYQISGTNDENLGYAVLTNDRRIGEIVSITDNSEFHSDISKVPFMQMFCLQLENYIEETAEIWNSLTDDDLEEARSAYSGIGASGNYTYSNWKYNSGNISNILTTKWGQGNPYNAGIAAAKGDNYLTGCGATAVAQVMAFHEYPKVCSDTIKNELNSKWSAASSWNGIYDWNAIKEYENGYYLSSAGKMMLGAFMYQVAEGVQSSYGTSATSTYTSNYPPFLQSVGYSTDSIQGYSFESIYNSINNDCPVVITGAAKKHIGEHRFLWWTWETDDGYSEGHAWVVDGYCNMRCTATNINDSNDVQTFTSNYVHCNLGWSGLDNGYYLDGVFSTNVGAVASDYTVNNLARRIEGEDYYYQYNLQIITNIRPNN